MHQVPSLKYKYDALEPYIDEATMKIHHTKHHQAYVDKLNAALEKYPDLAQLSIDDLMRDLSKVPEDIRTAVRNHGGGHWNHSFFWEIMMPPKGEKEPLPRELTIGKIDEAFVSFDGFKQKWKEAALNRFGSGWTWLVVGKTGKLEIISSANQDTPWSDGLRPILGLDVWEHAYYLKYQNKRPDYVAAWWNVVNWDVVSRRLSV